MKFLQVPVRIIDDAITTFTRLVPSSADPDWPPARVTPGHRQPSFGEDPRHDNSTGAHMSWIAGRGILNRYNKLPDLNIKILKTPRN